MTTSTNENNVHVGGAFADALTWIRVLLTPLIMFIIIKGGWPEIGMALFASMLFAVAALTDIFDDLIGGADTSRARKLGWFDDIADTVLIGGTLAAMLWAIYSSGFLTWVFAVPAGLIIARDVVIGLVKGKTLRKAGWPETKLGTLKTAVSMLAICLMIASPWLTNWIGGMSGDEMTAAGSYSAPWVRRTALALLWIAAMLSVVTGGMILSGKMGPANDA